MTETTNQEATATYTALPALDTFVMGLPLLALSVLFHQGLSNMITAPPELLLSTGTIAIIVSSLVTLFGTLRYQTTFSPTKRTIHRTVFILFFLPISVKTLKFGEVRAIDLFHPSGGSIDQPLDLALFFWGGIFQLAMHFLIPFFKTLGAVSIRCQLRNGSDFLICKRGSEVFCQNEGTRLARMTGTHLT